MYLSTSSKKQFLIFESSPMFSNLFLDIVLIEHLVECLNISTFFEKDNLIKSCNVSAPDNKLQLNLVEEELNQPIKKF